VSPIGVDVLNLTAYLSAYGGGGGGGGYGPVTYLTF